jgi:hypothetical protein
VPAKLANEKYVVRAYVPTEPLLDDTYRLPNLERL